jgi:hypothetical protein
MGTDDTRPAALPATIPPARFEDFEGFRETTLAVFTDPRANAALRTVGGLLYAISLEYARYWPREPDGAFRCQARAVLADLRHLEGWLGHLAGESTASALSAEEDRLSTLCGTFVPALKSIGDALEFEIGPTVNERGFLSMEEVFRESDPLPWEEQRATARAWVIEAWVRGAGEGGDNRLLREMRDRAARAGSFSFYSILALETLDLLTETARVPLSHLGGAELVQHLLGAVDTPPAVAEYYTAALLK